MPLILIITGENERRLISTAMTREPDGDEATLRKKFMTVWI